MRRVAQKRDKSLDRIEIFRNRAILSWIPAHGCAERIHDLKQLKSVLAGQFGGKPA
ncbi:MAG: hypothetical protein ACP5PN_11215 [Steroidobacteraceae bacterium]